MASFIGAIDGGWAIVGKTLSNSESGVGIPASSIVGVASIPGVSGVYSYEHSSPDQQGELQFSQLKVW